MRSEKNTTMRLAARACVPLGSTARCQLLSGAAGAYALYGERNKGILGGFGQVHLLSRRGPGHIALCTRPGLVAQSPQPLFGQSQRRFRKANYADKVHDNEKTEEILEALEVRDDEKDTQPTRQVLNAKGKKSSSGQQGSEWPEEMTKGE